MIMKWEGGEYLVSKIVNIWLKLIKRGDFVFINRILVKSIVR